MALNLKNDRPSKLGFGCMRLPVRNGRAAEIDYKTAEEMIDEAYIHGVNIHIMSKNQRFSLEMF